MGLLADLLPKQEKPKGGLLAGLMPELEQVGPTMEQATSPFFEQQPFRGGDELDVRGLPGEFQGGGGGQFGGTGATGDFTKKRVFDMTRKAWQRGGQSINVDFLWHKVAMGQLDEASAMAAEKDIEDLNKRDPVSGKNWASKLWVQTVQMARPMAEGQFQGMKYGAIGAGGAALAGQAGPQLLAPEEIITVPGAYAAGQVVGSVKYWAEQGSGLVYREAIKQGLKPETARAAAAIAGPAYAFIEYSQVDKIIPGLGRIKGTILAKAIKIAKNFGTEVLEEGAQKALTDGVQTIGKLVEGKIDLADVPAEAKQIGKNVLTEMKQAAGPMALLQLPGAAVAAIETIGPETDVAERIPPIAEAVDTSGLPVSEQKQPQKPAEQVVTAEIPKVEAPVEPLKPPTREAKAAEEPVVKPTPVKPPSEVPGGKAGEVEVTVYRGAAQAEDAPTVKWYTSLQNEAQGYADAAGKRVKGEAGIEKRTIKLKNPYITTSSAEAINITEDTIKRLAAQGYDGLVYKSPARPKIGNIPAREAKTWVVPFEDITPTPAKAEAKPVEKKAEEEPERKVSRLAKRTEELAVEKQLTESLGELPTYETMKMADQARMATEEIDRDYEQAKQMALGIEAPPKGLRPAAIYEAVKYNATKEGDVETLRQLATESTIPAELSALGQEIKAADTRTALADPVKAMQDIMKKRETVVKKRRKVKSIKMETSRMTKEVKSIIRETTTRRQNWTEFVESIRC